MIPLIHNPKDIFAPQTVERGIVVHRACSVATGVYKASQIQQAYAVCSPHTDWYKKDYYGRTYRKGDKKLGKVLVKELTLHEGAWTDYLDIPEYRDEECYRGGKKSQWCGPPPEAIRPVELMTTEDFLTACQNLRDDAKARESLDLRIRLYNKQLKKFGLLGATISDNGGDMRIDCSELSLLQFFDRLGSQTK